MKHNFLVKDVKDIAITMKKAFYIAATGRPGPVVVDIPKDVQTAKTAYFYPQSVTMRSYNPVIKGHGGQIKKAIQLLMEAKRPMIYTGGGVVLGDASAELTQLVRSLGFPCTNTLMGLGGYPATDRSSSACSACTAPTKPTWRCSTATCCSRSARASTTA